MEKKKDFYTLVELMEKLRGENGCSWDKEQTIESLKVYLLEETYETLEAMDQGGDELKGELGDLLLNIVFQSQISKEKNEFTIDDVIEKICNKIITRHPHIFKEVQNLEPSQVKEQWEKIKLEEKEHRGRVSILDGIPKTLPPVLRSEKIIKKVRQVGFHWENTSEVLNKVQEEIEELKVEIKNRENEKIKDELGDVMFSLINLCNYLGFNPGDVLTKTNNKFEKRFRYMESKCNLKDTSKEEMEEKWQESKGVVG